MSESNLFRPDGNDSTAHKWVDIPYLQEVQTVGNYKGLAGYILHFTEEHRARVVEQDKAELAKIAAGTGQQWIKENGDDTYLLGTPTYIEGWVPEDHPRYEGYPRPLDFYLKEYEMRVTIPIYRLVTRRITPQRFLMEYMLRRNAAGDLPDAVSMGDSGVHEHYGLPKTKELPLCNTDHGRHHDEGGYCLNCGIKLWKEDFDV